ncbi:HDOD domain-containing protein [Geitlerinema splendidum]|nr:HDOD domain-containing protein [Geitlerinema splendidum]
MAAAHQFESNQVAEKIVSQMQDIAVLPQVVFKIMEMSADDSAGAQALEKAIVVDPGFSVKILTRANSAALALPKKVSSIREAIMFVGMGQIRQIAMAVGVYDMFLGKNDKENVRRRNWWRISVDTGTIGRRFAHEFPGVSPEEAYTCGLVHMIGKTLLDRYSSADWDKVELIQERGAPELGAERAVCGCDHVDVALAAARKWGFPDSLIAGIAYGLPPQAGDPYAKLRAVVALSHAFAVWSQDQADDKQMPAVDAWIFDVLGICPERLPALAGTALATIESESGALM